MRELGVTEAASSRGIAGKHESCPQQRERLAQATTVRDWPHFTFAHVSFVAHSHDSLVHPYPFPIPSTNRRCSPAHLPPPPPPPPHTHIHTTTRQASSFFLAAIYLVAGAPGAMMGWYLKLYNAAVKWVAASSPHSSSTCLLTS